VFKRILVPTDGSPRAEHAARAAIELAKYLDAAIVAIYVYLPLKTLATDPFTVFAPAMTAQEYKKMQLRAAAGYLGVIEDAARAAGVKCTTRAIENESAARAIVAVAQSPDAPCDLVFIGSHGRGVVAQTILGSVTTKVQALCTVPVLVYRDPADIEKNLPPAATKTTKKPSAEKSTKVVRKK
jgi:nucleotide-binding universal stress UspA family protein